ncbi:MAG: hypothetical protein LC114_19345, partial [Bryobacterales bacterium]|nr:hypothetical protein [Bryobacterales bacterium]
MRTMRVDEAHILDDRDATVYNVTVAIAQVLASVDECQREQSTMLEDQDGRHRKTPVQFPRDGCKIGA